MPIEPLRGCKIFGAMKAFSGIRDIISLMHGPIGCYYGAAYHQLAQDESSLGVITSSITHDKEVVFGGEQKLGELIEKAQFLYGDKKLAILGCCVPAIIGDDIEAVKEEFAPDALHVDGAGFKGEEWQGYEDALLQLIGMMKKGEKKERTVNILGFDTVSPRARADAAELKRLVAKSGWWTNTVLCVNADSMQIENMPNVERNIVLGGYGLRLAEVMRERFGTPYEIVEMPYGKYLTREFLRKVTGSDAVYEEDIMPSLERAYLFIQKMYEMPVAVIADDARAIALSKFFEIELGCEVVVSAAISGSPLHPEKSVGLFEIDELLKGAETGCDRLRLILGTTFQKRIAAELDAALIRVSYPSFDDVSLYDEAPYMGYRGEIVIIEKILNLFLNKYSEEVW
ncbi:nitrogenase component 1 [Desulfosarcina ovata]|uniref:Nitrogenase/oxidoreductase component 1 domain-containing protein n=1 Tax=Desulfosarcina ovata subsp. ovata TaxID=2752305 RepID=A0A5K8A9L8_9BACT|nr:nitrogenase component 1 [Desulfosarcina ovata]BBO89179.1 hypothetical protein DSCOOX_23590 [Desulfosarcina ovata subsp. ovata]